MDNKDVKAKPIANIDFILTIIKSLLVKNFLEQCFAFQIYSFIFVQVGK